MQNYQEQKNTLSKKVSTNNNINENEVKKIFAEVKLLKDKLEKCKNDSEMKKKKIDELLLQLPNIIDIKTPIGKSEQDNKLLKQNGVKRIFNFKPKNHLEIAEKLEFS